MTDGDLHEVGIEVVHAHGSDLTYCRDHAQKIANGADGIIYSLVRQSDHQAAIAALEAEVGRMREALEEIELGIDALSIEDDDGRRMAASEMKRQALEVVRSEMKALKGPEA